MRINIVLSLFLFSSFAYSQNRSLPTVIKGLEYQLEQAQKERSTIKQKLDAAFDSNDQAGANQAKVNELMDQDKKIKELSEKIANLRSKETSVQNVSQKSSTPKGFKSLEEATQQRSLLSTRISQSNASQQVKDEWRQELAGIDSAIEDFKAQEKKSESSSDKIDADGSLKRAAQNVLDNPNSSLDAKVKAGEMINEGTVSKLDLSTCEWDLDLPKRVLTVPGCDNKGTKVCTGYVVCKGIDKDQPIAPRMSTCSVDNCDDAVACTKERGYGSTSFIDGSSSVVKSLKNKPRAKKE